MSWGTFEVQNYTGDVIAVHVMPCDKEGVPKESHTRLVTEGPHFSLESGADGGLIGTKLADGLRAACPCRPQSSFNPFGVPVYVHNDPLEPLVDIIQ